MILRDSERQRARDRKRVDNRIEEHLTQRRLSLNFIFFYISVCPLAIETNKQESKDIFFIIV